MTATILRDTPSRMSNAGDSVRFLETKAGADLGAYRVRAEIEAPSSLSSSGRSRISPDGAMLAAAPAGAVAPLLIDIDAQTVAGAKGEAHRSQHALFGIDALEWSLDGSSLVTAQAFDAPRIWRRDGNGLTFAKKLAAKSVGRIAWSPDGRHLAFASPAEDPERKIAVCSADTGAVVRMLDVTYKVGRAIERPYDCFAWSPDGLFISTNAIQRPNLETIAGFNVRLVDPVSGENAPIIAAQKTVAFAPLADGNRVAILRTSGEMIFAHARSEETTRVGSITEWRDATDTTNRALEAWALAWSRDGGTIAFGTPRELVVMNADCERVASVPVPRGVFDVSSSISGDRIAVSQWERVGDARVASYLVFDRRV